MEWWQALIAIIGGFLLLVFLGVPINFALGLSFIPVLFFFSGERPGYVLDLFGMTAYRKLLHHSLIAVPLFILMGQLFYVTGTGMRLYEGFQRWLGWLPGGLAISTIATTTVFAAICGSSMISAGTLGPVSVPSMIKQGYSPKLALGSLCAGATLAMLIPPSIPFIFYAVMTEQSVGHLFLAGIVPGIMLSAMFTALTIIRVKKNPSLAPPTKLFPLRERIRAIPWLAGPLGLIFLIMFTLYTGIAGVNELAAIGVVGAIILGLVYRDLDLRKLVSALLHTGRFIGFAGTLFVSAVFMGWGLTYYGVSAQLTEWISSLVVPRVVILLIIMGMYLLLGMVMDASAIILVTIPVIYPIILQLGYDPIWFGVIFILNLEVGAITPPVGVNLFALKLAIPGVELKDAIFGSIPYVALIFVGMALLILFPDLALWLPRTMW